MSMSVQGMHSMCSKRRTTPWSTRPFKRPRSPTTSAATTGAAPASSALHINALPTEVLGRVFQQLRPCDVNSARAVCRSWRQVVDSNAVDIWRAACDRLGLFPTSDDASGTVLGQCAARTLSKASQLRTAGQAAQLYADHYHTWVVHICTVCVPRSISSDELCPACTPPEQFEWIRYPKSESSEARCVVCPQEAPTRPRPDTCYRLEDFVTMIDLHTADHIDSFVHTIRQLGYVLK